MSSHDAARAFLDLRHAAAAAPLARERQALLEECWAEVWLHITERVGAQASNIFLDDGSGGSFALSSAEIKTLFWAKPTSLSKYGFYIIGYESHLSQQGIEPWPASVLKLLSYVKHKADVVSDEGDGC